jgi:hypothetical protein
MDALTLFVERFNADHNLQQRFENDPIGTLRDQGVAIDSELARRLVSSVVGSRPLCISEAPWAQAMGITSHRPAGVAKEIGESGTGVSLKQC